MLPGEHTAEAAAQHGGLLLGMELPVIGGRGAATIEALVRAVRKGNLELSRALAPQETPHEGALALCNPNLSMCPAACCARDVHVPAGSDAEAVLSRIEAYFSAQHATCHLLAPTAAALDDSWHEPLTRRDYTTRHQALLMLGTTVHSPRRPEGYQAVSARAVVPGYCAFLDRWAAARSCAADSCLAVCEAGLLDSDALDVLVIRKDGQVVGCVGALTVSEIGILRALRVDDHADLDATVDALLWHVLDLAKRSQFRQIIAAVDETDETSTEALGRIGMTRVEVIEHYVRDAGEAAG